MQKEASMLPLPLGEGRGEGTASPSVRPTRGLSPRANPRALARLGLTFRIEQFIQFFFWNAGGFKSNLAYCPTGVISDFGNLCGLVITDHWRQRGAHREALFDIAFAFFAIH